MYLPKHFQETDTKKLHQLIRAHPLATIITPTPSGFDANHIPLLLDTQAAPLGILRGHVARANPIWRNLQPERETLAIFQGQSRYISPAWYPAKAETGKVVPTWNYTAVHARGILTVIEDRDQLLKILETTTAEHENQRNNPWNVSDAPSDYIDRMLNAIVGIELKIDTLEGKWKMSQNKNSQTRAGVVEGLLNEKDSAAHKMAQTISTT